MPFKCYLFYEMRILLQSRKLSVLLEGNCCLRLQHVQLTRKLIACPFVF